METLARALDFPQASLVSVHVAGTKGKGSTAAFMASALSEHGYKTGLYTSPHVTSYAERFSIDGSQAEESLLVASIRRIRDTVSAMQARKEITPPTVFELLTLCAFCVFRDSGCTHAVFEAGLGGRLDATNIIEPRACIITPIDLDHTEILGDTLEKIAAEKGGIIKSKTPVFVGNQTKGVKDVFSEITKRKGACIRFLDEELEHMDIRATSKATEAIIKLSGFPETSLSLSMLGDFQAENAGLSLLTLLHAFPEVGIQSVQAGFKKAFLPGRMEVVLRSPPVVLDGAHTVLAAEKLLASFEKLFPGKKILLFGAIRGKDFMGMGSILARRFEKIIISTPDAARGSDRISDDHTEGIFSFFKSQNIETYIEKDVSRAYEKALEFSSGALPILVTGSFYLISSIRKLIRGEGP